MFRGPAELRLPPEDGTSDRWVRMGSADSSMTLMFPQFLGILVAVLLLQVTAGVLAYLFTDLVRSPGTVAMAS